MAGPAWAAGSVYVTNFVSGSVSGLYIGDLFGHIALPAKITTQMLEPIERFGPSPDVDAIYDAVTGLMQQTLDELAAERRWPVIR